MCRDFHGSAESAGQAAETGDSTSMGAGGRLWRALFTPMVEPLLERRGTALVFAVAGTGQVVAALLHLPGMPCPVMRLLGVPCPGCGASRACAALLRGRVSDAWRWHAFAPMFLLAIILFWVAALVPSPLRNRLAHWLGHAERRLALSVLLLGLALLYWFARLMYAPDVLARLAGG